MFVNRQPLAISMAGKDDGFTLIKLNLPIMRLQVGMNPMVKYANFAQQMHRLIRRIAAQNVKAQVTLPLLPQELVCGTRVQHSARGVKNKACLRCKGIKVCFDVVPGKRLNQPLSRK